MKEYLNYFGENEKDAMGAFGKWRTQILRPILVVLTKLHITADHITLLSLALMIGCAASIIYSLEFSFAFLILHIFLDCADGPLARHQNAASNRGALADICNDQIGLAIFVFTLIALNLVDAFWAALYITSYIVMITFLVVLNAFKRPVRHVIRSKYLFYTFFYLEVFSLVMIFDVIVMLFALHTAFTAIWLFWKLRCSL